MSGVSLCTYTYNDGQFIEGFLRSVERQSLRPARVIVVDDGSRRPCRLPATDLPVEIVRLEDNQGPTKVRTLALGMCDTPLLASADCDMRLAPRWIELCARRLEDPAMGLVGGPILDRSGSDSMSRYLRLFGEYIAFTHGPAKVVPGGAWMIRKATWDELGGFGDYAKRTKQDMHLSETVRNRGLTLFCEGGAEAYQVRKLSRRAFVRRCYARVEAPFQAALSTGVRAEDFPAMFSTGLLRFNLARMNRILAEGEPTPCYIELAYALHSLLALTGWAVAQGIFDQGLLDCLWPELEGFFQRWPKLWRFLRRDLAAFGHTIPQAATPAAPAVWSPVLADLDQLRAVGLLDHLESAGLALLLAEELKARHDFSFWE